MLLVYSGFSSHLLLGSDGTRLLSRGLCSLCDAGAGEMMHSDACRSFTSCMQMATALQELQAPSRVVQALLPMSPLSQACLSSETPTHQGSRLRAGVECPCVTSPHRLGKASDRSDLPFTRNPEPEPSRTTSDRGLPETPDGRPLSTLGRHLAPDRASPSFCQDRFTVYKVLVVCGQVSPCTRCRRGMAVRRQVHVTSSASLSRSP